MIQDFIDEYLASAEEALTVDYSDKRSVRRYNALVERMRAIADAVVNLGPDAVLQFTSLLDKDPAAIWAAHHLVEKADLDDVTLSRCFECVENEKRAAEEKGDLANAMGEEMWLKEWKTRNG